MVFSWLYSLQKNNAKKSPFYFYRLSSLLNNIAFPDSICNQRNYCHSNIAIVDDFGIISYRHNYQYYRSFQKMIRSPWKTISPQLASVSSQFDGRLKIIIQTHNLITIAMVYFRPVKSKRRSKRYDKVSHKTRMILLKKVLCDSCEIKESAEQLEINYSTAKTIMRKYKQHGRDMNLLVLKGISDWYQSYEVSRQRCSYKQVLTPENKVTGEQKDWRKSQDPEKVKLEQQISPFLVLAQGNQKIQILQQVLFDR